MSPAAIPRYAIVLSLGLIAAALVVAAAATGRFDRLPPQPYFPVAFRQPSVTCPPDYPGDPPQPTRPVLGEIEAEWYPAHLRAAQEPSLYLASIRAPKSRSYRFTWLRSFDAPVLVRIDEVSGGDLRLTATRLSGAGGYEPGAIAQRLERTLTPTEAVAFRKVLTTTRVLDQPATDCALGHDGAVWMIEANDKGAYRYVNRWSPQSGPVQETGLAMLALTGWTFDPA